MAIELNSEAIRSYRAETFRLHRPLHNREEAIAFVAERGFVYFWPIKEVVLPSLWVAVAGDRPVADEHDDPGHITWGWKDDLLGKRIWYYAKVLRRRATIISLDVVPYFYALSENYGEPEKDYLLQYEEGRLTFEAKTIYETLLNEGPLDTISLRKLARMTSKASDSPFNRALELLQADFKILPVGVAEAGAWNYAFIYECVHRHYSDLPERARPIRQAEARRQLAKLYLRSVGAARERDLALLFGWPPRECAAALAALERDGIVVRGVTVAGQGGEWVAWAELAAS
ncbi:MAG: winged helix DNA-binding domain-containing protein [Anaerolineae bacterium]|nr:winged helix DNA-binding domain-containing protein [Anaerolineae bacterium]